MHSQVIMSKLLIVGSQSVYVFAEMTNKMENNVLPSHMHSR